MAYDKQLSIKNKRHLKQALDYICREEKTDNLVTGLNCNPENAILQFDTIRKLYGKQEDVLAHHVIHSFKNFEVDKDTAHKIGIELAEKIAPGYQVVVATHIDKDNVHNHIFINSVNAETGYKYYANKNSLKFIREESNKLSRKYGLSVIDTKGKGIDQSTYRLAEQGKSWKVKLSRTIDEAVSVSKTKEEFIRYMNNVGYKVKWQNKNISFKDPEHEKFIRGYRLGEDYTKEMIENRLGIFEERDNREEQNHLRDVSGSYARASENPRESKSNHEEPSADTRKNRKARRYQNEWEKYESYRRKNNLSKAAMVAKVFKEDKRKEDRILDDQIRFMNLIIRIIKKLRKKHNKANPKNLYNYNNRNRKLKTKVNVKLKENSKIRYRDLKEMEGENYYIKGTLKDALKLKSENIICVTFNKGDYYNIVIKEKDKLNALEFLNRIDKECGSVSYSNLKKLIDDKPHYINLKRNEYEKLKDSSIEFAAFDRGEVVKTVIKREDLKNVIEVIGRDVDIQIGNITYAKLKSMEGKADYRVINEKQYKDVKASGIKFAAFQKEDGKINIAFKEIDVERVNEIMKTKHEKVR